MYATCVSFAKGIFYPLSAFYLVLCVLHTHMEAPFIYCKSFLQHVQKQMFPLVCSISFNFISNCHLTEGFYLYIYIISFMVYKFYLLFRKTFLILRVIIFLYPLQILL